MDYACLGFNKVGEMVHVSRGEEEFCKRCAEQIKEDYSMVKVVDDDVADMLIDADLKKWVRRIKYDEIFSSEQ